MEKSPEELEALRRGYTPELWPVLERYGRDMVQFAMLVLATNEAIDAVIEVSKQVVPLRTASVVLSNNMTGLCQWICESEKWDFNEHVMPCMLDVNRARQLAGPAASAGVH